MIKVNFDGACGPHNPGGKCGGGAVIIKDNELLAEIFERYQPKLFWETSNNVGEYYGLIKALEYLIDNKLHDEQIEVFGDSKLVISQMQGKWRIKKGLYLDLALKALYLRRYFKNIKFNWIPREENEWADQLSKNAIVDCPELPDDLNHLKSISNAN